MNVCSTCQKEFVKKRKAQRFCGQTCARSYARTFVKPSKGRSGNEIECINCKKPFFVESWRFRKYNVQYCSYYCLGKRQLTPDHGFKKSYEKSHGRYKRIIIKGKRIFEHRLVMEKFLGRNLKVTEHVHHINGNTLDNRVENLTIMTASEHMKLHHPPFLNDS